MTNRLIRHVTFLVMLCLASPLHAQTERARLSNPLSTYAQRYATINRELTTYRTIAVDMESLGIERRSTDGGRIEASCKGSETRRIVAIDYGEHGSTTTNFYFWNNSLFFVQRLSQRSDALYGPTVESSDDRLYYLNGRLVKWVDGRNSPRPINTADARKTDQFVRNDATTFYSHLNGCPIGVLPEADQDTAAPAMVPAPPAYDTGMKIAPSPNDAIRERAYVATMKMDLRNLATYEEQFAADHNGAYFAGTTTSTSALHGFTPSADVTISATRTRGSPPNWSATATHAKSSTICATKDGLINCD